MAKRKSLAAQILEARREQQEFERQHEIARRGQQHNEAARLEKEQQRQLKRESDEQRRQWEQTQREAARLKKEELARAERIERDSRRRQAQHQQDLKRAERTKQQNQARAAEARLRQDAADRSKAIEERLAELDEILLNRELNYRIHALAAEELYKNDGPAAFIAAMESTINTSGYTGDLQAHARVDFHAEAGELRIEYEMPGKAVIPEVTGYRYMKTENCLRPVPRKDSDIHVRYQNLVARTALRVLAEMFDITSSDLVASIVLNGHVTTIDRATGKSIRPCILSVLATRDQFADLVLDEPRLDPVLCLHHLNAIVSPHPHDLEAVRPVVSFDLSSYRLIDAVDMVTGLDSRADLLALTPQEFEHLVHDLFQAIGLNAKVTRGSKDGGIDIVAMNNDPVIGGLCVIQVKRYKNVVGLEAVHALAGVMEEKKATKGILVTTSWFGKASRDFAARGGRMELIDGRGLKSMFKEHLDRDVLIGLPKTPRDWSRRDSA